jgi:hypothetical protein
MSEKEAKKTRASNPKMKIEDFVVHICEVAKIGGTVGDLAARIGRSYQSTHTRLHSLKKNYPEINLPNLSVGKKGNKLDPIALNALIMQQYSKENQQGKALKIAPLS